MRVFDWEEQEVNVPWRLYDTFVQFSNDVEVRLFNRLAEASFRRLRALLHRRVR